MFCPPGALNDADGVVLTFEQLVVGYLEDYELHGYLAVKAPAVASRSCARGLAGSQ